MKAILIACATAAALVAGAAVPASAQTYPSKPVTLVVPYAAGGTADVVSRVVAQDLGPLLGKGVVVDKLDGESTP